MCRAGPADIRRASAALLYGGEEKNVQKRLEKRLYRC